MLLAAVRGPARLAAAHTKVLRNQARLRLQRHRGWRQADRLSWVLVASMANSGSTAFAQILSTAPGTGLLGESGEGIRLLRAQVPGWQRWKPRTEDDLDLLRAVWIAAAQRCPGRPAVLIDKSPPLLPFASSVAAALSRDMPVTMIGLTRDPYAVCASWAKRYGEREVARGVRRDLSDALDGPDGTRIAFRVLGQAYAKSLAQIDALSDGLRLTVRYEDVTGRPAAAARAIADAIPVLAGLDMTVPVRVKDYPPAPLRDMNARQVSRLTDADRAAITEGLIPAESLLGRHGYALMRA